jgi:hypothetical protein
LKVISLLGEESLVCQLVHEPRCAHH